MVQGFSKEPGTQGPLTEVPPAAARRITGWAAAIALGGFLFGFGTGVVSGALPPSVRAEGSTGSRRGAGPKA
ncbi:hypothetical protein PXH67_23660 [Streptomyces sp. P8-A8]|nr:hypothetical protein [Streptomyces sp. NBC_00439]WSP47680.1 hypothetical protein OG348_18315 [Streptomyces sp. NBC_01243]